MLLAEQYDAVLVFSNTIARNDTAADARAVVCSLLVQSMLAERPKDAGSDIDTAVITEIKDRRSLQLLRVAGESDDFVIANELSSAMICHLARTPDLRHFWIDHILSTAHGANNLSIVRLDRFVDCDSCDVSSLTFRDLLATCRAKGAIPIAVKRLSSSSTKWRFNPAKKGIPLGLGAHDHILVLAPQVSAGSQPHPPERSDPPQFARPTVATLE